MAKTEHAAGTVNAEQMAAALDCNRRTMERYAEQGLVVKVSRGRYHFLTSIRNVIGHLRKQAASQQSASGLNAVDENVLLKQTQRKLAELRYEQLNGSVISLPEVEEAWSALVVATRQLVLSIPGRARAELPHLTGADQKALQLICHGVLKESALTNGEDMPLPAAAREAES